MTVQVIEKTKKSTTKAKARLKDLTFDHDNAHLALCSKEQGAANNQENAVIFKSANFSKELIEKAQKVQVTMELPEFLRRFFSLYWDDAEVLARLMGWVPEDDDEEEYTDWIQERVDSFELLKSLHEAKSLPEEMAKLSEDQISQILDDQEMIVKSLKEFESSQMLENKVGSPTANSGPTGTKKIKKEKKMTQEVETIEKSKYVEIEKAMQAQAEELLKAREMLATIEKAEKALILKTKTDAVNAVVKDAKHAETVLKAALALEKQEDFDALVNVFKSMQEVIEKSAGFTEVGASVQAGEEAEESKTMAFLKSKYAQKEVK